MKITQPLAPYFTYTIGRNLYIPITSRSNARTLPETRGPNFLLGPDVVAALCRVRDAEQHTMQWEPWCQYLDTQEMKQRLPTALELVAELPSTKEERAPTVSTLCSQIITAVKGGSNFESIVFAGEGEPTLRLEDMVNVADNLKDFSGENLPTLRLTTNGLSEDPDSVIGMLTYANIMSVSVALMTSDSKQYNQLMTPEISNGHDRVCSFIRKAVEMGLDVEATAVDRDDVDKAATESLAASLKVAKPIRWRPYFS